jgi:diguanylate cyclase (GGDEF)-like protein
MLENILIAILAFSIGLLSTLIIIRRRSVQGEVSISQAALDELLAAVANNIKEGRIQDIAGRVSLVLRKYLHCEKIIFLKYYRNQLEMNYYWGLQKFNRDDFRLKLLPALQAKLKESHKILPIDELDSIVSRDYLNRLRQNGLLYFFPAFLRENLYGVYFIKTELRPDNVSLQFLAATLAFNLSTAYHIGVQDQQLKKYEEKVKSLVEAKEKQVSSRTVSVQNEYLKYLKIKNSKELISELISNLRKECDFSHMIFCVRNGDSDESLISVNWNIGHEANKVLKESYDLLAGQMSPDKIWELNDIPFATPALENNLHKMKENEIKYLAALPWIDNQKAIIGWKSARGSNDIAGRLKKFRTEALPFIENADCFERMEELSYTDGLTGVYNFRFFKKRINEEYRRAKRYSRNLALLILDIDDLKLINDNYGHLAGDSLLKSFGNILLESVRSDDVVSRYGGDEFCLIMPETNRERTRQFMERIRDRIARNPVLLEGVPERQNYSVSIGGAVFPLDADSIDGLIKAADMALLKAKEEGRNCSKLYIPEYDRQTQES